MTAANRRPSARARRYSSTTADPSLDPFERTGAKRIVVEDRARNPEDERVLRKNAGGKGAGNAWVCFPPVRSA